MKSQKTTGLLKKFGVAGLALAFGSGLLFLYYAKDLPRPEKFTELTIIQPTRIYDRTGTVLLYEIYGDQRREVIPLSEVSDVMKVAVIATEDANFYRHFGLDWRGIARAVLANLKLMRTAQGGSTISQQLVRNSFLTRKKTIERKVQEVILTLELERRYSKDQILEWYLNQIAFGPNIYGVAAASREYFAKKPSELTVAESAALTAMIKAPSYYSPFGNHQDKLMERKNYVLERMVKELYISKEEAEAAKKQQLAFQESGQKMKAPHFTLDVMEYLYDRYGERFLQENGLKVYTSLDWNLQQFAEEGISEHAKRNESLNSYNAALAALDPSTGQILAQVGSKNWYGEPEPKGCMPGRNCRFDPKFNVATALPGRQPGSAFKPFVYATAFEKGYDDTTIVVDEETNFGVWGDKEYIPQNYDGKFRGPVALRQALAQSLNIPSIKVLLEFAGIQESIQTAKRMGISTLSDDPSMYGPSLVLGGGEARLLDMVSAYGVFAAEGKRAPALSILKIQNSDGAIIEENKRTPMQVLSAHSAELVSNILSDNEARSPIFGSRSLLYFPNETVSVKTGTTQDFKDGWIIGYTSDIAAGVWVGNNDGTLMEKEPGVVLAGPIWHQFMQNALNYLANNNE
ncbi:MAG: PBP1A family penicillin-binding protein [Candidatus Wildermuthbacteria bacterium]|nr:PBP1A family penicillin-binding protein [Candidatus Wildermuthbacteria bacterium]